MSLVITTDVFCDHPECADWEHGVVSNGVRGSAARKKVAQAGWVSRYFPDPDRLRSRGVIRDLCPEHADIVEWPT